MHRSVATLSNPEFINLQPLDISPFISKCDIKVLYLNENRNRTYITKETAVEMAKSLRGNPIVGAYNEQTGDFTDHNEIMKITDDGIEFTTDTFPYGFVAPDAKVWFQDFEDTNSDGTTTVRKYLMTTGYLWTGQFPECSRVIEKGNPQSMELDEKTMSGHWTKIDNRNIEFFIINDAFFSKLCILGDDVEPCFEGASVTKPVTTFSKSDNFNKTLFTMMEELQNIVVSKGGKQMDNINEAAAAPVAEETPPAVVEAPAAEVEKPAEEAPAEEVVNEPVVEEAAPAVEEVAVEPAAEEAQPEAVDNEPAANEISQLKFQLQTLQTSYDSLKADYDNLFAFKKNIEDKQKDELIESFYMLSDEDKADVIQNKSNYSLDDIEAKLSVIGRRKGVNFASAVEETAPSAATLFNLDSVADNTPAWILAVEQKQNMNNI